LCECTGRGAAQALLQAGELDELELHVVPVLLGQGRRLFDNLPAEHVELALVRRLTPRTTRTLRSASRTRATAFSSPS
jgi:dihydrofolate reductase